jgi:hypothetical protein
MQKKIFLTALIFFTIIFAAFSQQKVENLNGFNWVTWTQEQKVGYVQGFMSAYSTVMEMMIYEMGDQVSEEKIQEINNRFHIPISVGQIGAKMDRIYSSYDNRKYPIYDVFLIVVGKDYWNEGDPRNERNKSP